MVASIYNIHRCFDDQEIIAAMMNKWELVDGSHHSMRT
jgi:hypothetical protein